jgi:hypothetical protein
MPKWFERKWLLRVLAVVFSATLGFAVLRLGKRALPADPTAASVLERGDAAACHRVSDFASPLVVDWEAHERINMEGAMHDGIAVVAYDCRSLRLLHGCSVDGSYGFLAASRNEVVVQLEDKDDLLVNLSGVLATKLDAELARGSTLEVAMVLVGKKRTTVQHVARPTLRGGAACQDATHFVSGAFVGAFALGLGTKAKVRSATEVFAGGSETAKVSQYRDGQQSKCEQLPETATTPSPECHALVRLELAALDAPVEPPIVTPTLATAEPPDAAQPAKPELVKAASHAVQAVCPEGFVLREDKCTRPKANQTHLCKRGDAQDCQTQCTQGNAGSCANLGLMYSKGEGVAKDDARAAAFDKQACDGGSPLGCYDLGIDYDSGWGVAKDSARAVSLYKQACDGGHARACVNLGYMYTLGLGGLSQDYARALVLYKQACDGGNARGCYDLGSMYQQGRSVEPDIGRARALYKRSCDGGDREGCDHLRSLGPAP